MIQSASMITPMAMACSKTRNRISFCDVLPEPPIIILTSPSKSTIATAPMAIETATWDMKLAMSHCSPDGAKRNPGAAARRGRPRITLRSIRATC